MAVDQALAETPSAILRQDQVDFVRGHTVCVASDPDPQIRVGGHDLSGDIHAAHPVSSDGDSPVLPELLNQIPEDENIGTVTADGAYDTRRCHTAIVDRQATAIIAIRKNGRPWKADCPAAIARNETLRATRHYGRAFWKRWTGYHVRSRIEAKMRCLKAFGERIAARDPDRQTAEIQIRRALMNRFSALGTAEIVRVA